MKFKNIYAKEIALHLSSFSQSEVEQLIEKPKFEEQGDLAFPCFSLAKTLKESPQKIALELANKIQHPLFETVVATGPYVNCFLNKQTVSKEILETILKEDKNYGFVPMGEGKNIVIDFSSPNIAKPFSMGHLRSTVIGNALSTIAEKCCYNVTKINHLGDWGTQFGKLIVAYKKWGNESTVKENPIEELLSLYVKFHTEAELNPFLEDEARAWFLKLEEGNDEAQALWKWFRDESLKEFSNIYRLLDVTFDTYQGEAFYNDKMDRTVEKLQNVNLLTESEGAEVVELKENNLPPCLIKKSDGATLYATRDLTAAVYRYEKYSFEQAIYVVGHEQSLHFKQVFLVLEKMGYSWAKGLKHIPFGFILKDGKKMSTRKGKVVLLEEVITEAIALAKQNIATKNPDLEDKEEVAKMVGVGAIIFHDLKNERQNNVEFSLNDMLKFEGTTGPYVQYTHARARSILEKAKYNEKSLNVDGLTDKHSWSVLKRLMEFPVVIEKSFSQHEPSQIAKYLIDVSQEFNKYYAHVKVLSDDNLLESRLTLVKAVTIVLKEGLRLLGIKAPNQM
ncbi:arginine--tRNA ligase [Bacillus solitudinis]|uniref:arginine--tRNA ligase n=1 Tax=Bacillus solitudinis TaxID=2014074 RepID=UPI000C24C3D5|nr:arginine--tRNA ligase [Bacillus solitudinis]